MLVERLPGSRIAYSLLCAKCHAINANVKCRGHLELTEVRTVAWAELYETEQNALGNNGPSSYLAKCMVRRRTARGLMNRKDGPRKCIRPLSGEFSPGLDDDTHVSVLINPSVTRDAFSPPGFPARHWAVLLVFFSPQQTLVELFLTSVVVAVEKLESVLCFPSAASFSTAIKPLSVAVAADVDCP
jgi:hypothetical protein